MSPRVTPNAVRALVAMMARTSAPADDLVDGIDGRIERLRVVVPGPEYDGKRWGGAATVRGANLPNARHTVRIRAL